MYKNSAMLKFGLSIMMLAFAVVPARAAGGGGEATPDQMPAICKAQAASLKLAGTAADSFIQTCTTASANPAARKSAARLEGKK
jgi:hypothetical protein